MASKKYKQKQWLEKKVVDESLRYHEVAKMCGVSKGTIWRWVDNFNIDISGRDRVKTECEECGEEIEKVKSQINENNFCSEECHNTWRKNRIELSCEKCGSNFERVKSQIENSDKHFCSRKCRGQYYTEEKHPNKNIKKLNCDNCGTQFERPISHLGKYNNFCSKDCYYTWVEHSHARNTNKAKRWRNEVRSRDNWKCCDCGEKRDNIEAHHREKWSNNPSKRFDLDNGVSVCPECHYIRHKERNDIRAIRLMEDRVDLNRVEKLILEDSSA